jgi:hypothetical protein
LSGLLFWKRLKNHLDSRSIMFEVICDAFPVTNSVDGPPAIQALMHINGAPQEACNKDSREKGGDCHEAH